jgi:hypothetical protein
MPHLIAAGFFLQGVKNEKNTTWNVMKQPLLYGVILQSNEMMRQDSAR